MEKVVIENMATLFKENLAAQFQLWIEYRSMIWNDANRVQIKFVCHQIFFTFSDRCNSERWNNTAVTASSPVATDQQSSDVDKRVTQCLINW